MWGRELNYSATIRDPPPTPPELFSLEEEPGGACQTGCLPCLDRRSRHSGAPCSRSSILSLCFRLSMILRRRWWNSCQISSISCVLSPDPEQAIEVPKILPVDVPLRTSVREPQLVEKLVEVPTIISFSSLQRIAEQNNDVIPVPDRGGRDVGLQGFSPRQSSTAQHASQELSSERIAEQIVDSRALGGGSSASSSSSREHAGEGVFQTFHRVKKSPKLGSHSGSELLPESSPSTLSAHQMATDERTSMEDANGHAWVRLDTARATFWQNLDTGHQQWRPPWEH